MKVVADVWKISRPRDISSDLEAISRPREISRSPAISSNLKQSRSTETQLQNQGNSLLWRQAQFTYRQKAAITESLAHGELLFENLARAKCLLYTHQSLFRTAHISYCFKPISARGDDNLLHVYREDEISFYCVWDTTIYNLSLLVCFSQWCVVHVGRSTWLISILEFEN